MSRVGLVAIAVGLLALTACSRSSGGRSATTDGSGLGTSQGATDTTAGAGDFGTLKQVCGKGSGGNVATGRGVTADSIDLGVISDAGFVGKPGLNEELWQASDVFVKWCNSLGGINGRKLVGTHLDAALTQYKQQILKACDTAFALVGGGGVIDDAGEKERLSCLLPSFPGFLLTPVARASELKWQAAPAPISTVSSNSFRWVADHFPTAKAKVGILTASVSATIVVARQYKEILGKLGFTLTSFDKQYNALGEASWVPFATGMKTSGVRGLVFLGEPQDLAKLERAMKSIDYTPEFILTLPNIYDRSFLEATGGTAFNTFVPTGVYPFELADRKAAGSEATQKYLSLFARYAPKGKARSYLGVESFASWLLFAQAAKPCGARLTARCLYDNAQKITDFDAGGLIAPADPATGALPLCGAVVQAKGDHFVVEDVKPNRGAFHCNPDAALHLTGDYGKGLTLADVGKSIADLK